MQGRPANSTGFVEGGAEGIFQVRVEGEVHHIPSSDGVNYAAGTSVSVQRLENGRYQIVGMASHWAPRP